MPRLNERGIALAAAIFALAVIGAIVAGNFFLGRLEQQSGRSLLFAYQAHAAAEAGLAEAAANISAGVLEQLAVGELLDLGTLDLGTGVSVSRHLSRLTADLFLIRARGTRFDAGGNPLATRSLGSLIRLVNTDVTPVERGWTQLH
jgi:hypothetical protein